MDEKSVTVEQAVKLLNDIHRLDPTVLPGMMKHRVPCNRAVADHPTVQVGGVPCLNGPETEFHIGLLGILNGLFGVDYRGYGFIVAEFDFHDKLLGFSVNPMPPRLT